jgi:HD-GYP domain-containing protein (c-di-GMP phosphodiesterase class II)
MTEIPLSSLMIGSITEREYFTRDGELLISKGVSFSQQHLDALLRRKFEYVYINDENEDMELQKILSADFKGLDDLQLEETGAWSSNETPAALNSPALSKIASGRDGLLQLLKNATGNEIDTKIRDGKTPDTPVGPALKEKASEMTSKDRTPAYKNSIKTSYTESLQQTKRLLTLLVNDQHVSNESVRSVVNQFINTYLTDKNILLNLSNTKPQDGDYIYHHSLNVAILSINIAAALSYSEQQVIEIGMGALLHDVGMLLIPKAIRLKKGRLVEEEWYEIQKHPILGLHLLEKIDRLPDAVSIVAYQTHERENGKGYPKQRSARIIHNYAKIVSVADIFEALSTSRSYRDGNIPYKAMEMIIKMTRQGLISGEFVKALLEYTSLFPVGSIVELSNNCLGKVIKANGNSFAKPRVSIFTDPEGNKLDSSKIYEEDLSKNTTIQIIRAHPSTMTDDDIMMGF